MDQLAHKLKGAGRLLIAAAFATAALLMFAKELKELFTFLVGLFN